MRQFFCRRTSGLILLAACSHAAAQGQDQPRAHMPTDEDLSHQTTQRLDSIVVRAADTGNRALLDTPASVSVLDGQDLRRAAMQVNLTERLGAVPGLQAQNRQNYAQDLQLSIRGFGARATFGLRGVRLYVDGIPATMPDGQGQTSNIDIGTLDQLEVLRGPFSALYGNASGGVILASTERGAQPPELSAGTALGSDATWRTNARASGATDLGGTQMDYVLGLSRLRTDGYRDHSAARKTLGNARLGLAFDDGSTLTLVMNHVDLRADDPLGLTRAQFQQDPRQAPLAQQYDTRKTVRQSQGGLVYERPVGDAHQLRLMAYYGQRHTRQFLAIPPAAQARPLHAGGVIDLTRQYAGMDLRWTSRLSLGGRPLTLATGLAYDTLREARKGYENFVDHGAGPNLGEQGRLRRDETNRVWNLDPYLQASWRVSERWTLDAGLRLSQVRFSSRDHYVTAANGDDSGSATYRKLLPAASLHYAATPTLSLYASAGRGFETPTLNELSYRSDEQPGLNFPLQPSTSTNLELGAKAQLSNGLLTAALFHTRTRDEILTAANVGGRATFRNAGDTRRVGAELAWQARWAAHWKTQLAYTWLDATYRQDDACLPACSNGVRAGNRLPGTARHALYASAAWAPPTGWRAGIDLQALGNIMVNDANDDRAPGYLTFGADVGYRWRTGPWLLDLFARVDNVFDRRYAGSVIINEGNARYFEPAPGRHWSTGLNVSYTF